MKSKIYVLDTNIWVSFIIGKKIHELVKIIIDNNLKVLTCDQLIGELKDVLHRPKFSKYISKEDINEAIIIHLKTTKKTECKNVLNGFRDRNDNYLLGLSKAGKAGYLVSGDNDILESKIKPPPLIISMKEFLNLFNQ